MFGEYSPTVKEYQLFSNVMYLRHFWRMPSKGFSLILVILYSYLCAKFHHNAYKMGIEYMAGWIKLQVEN